MLAQELDLEIYFLKEGAARIKINEKGSDRFGINSDMPGGAGVEEEQLEYLEAFVIDKSDPRFIKLSYLSSDNVEFTYEIRLSPFRIY
jgi:predicted molibdopterin-dependent oxidoreductase YjgC